MNKLILLTKIVFTLLLFIASDVNAEGSMRIEVEVYDGPLSKSLPIQQAELIGTLEIAHHATANLIRSIHVSQCRLGCFGTRRKVADTEPPFLQICQLKTELQLINDQVIFSKESEELFKTIFPKKKYKKLELRSPISEGKLVWPLVFEDMEKIPTNVQDSLHQVCPQMHDLKTNLYTVFQYIQGPQPDIEQSPAGLLGCRRVLVNANRADLDKPGDARKCLTRIAKVGKLLSEGAEHWAGSQIATISGSRRARIEIVKAAVTAAELGNELTARADAIIRQAKGESILQLLPNSMYLRESEGTDYLNLMEWLDASPRNNEKWSPQSRTRMIERLINDSNWSRINTAFAQGAGKVNMVFVKDDIGNWNLKNYANLPTEMLNNYKDIGTNLAKSAARLAKKASNLNQIDAVLDGVDKIKKTSDETTFGTNNSNSTFGIAMENATKKRLYNTFTTFVTKQTSLNEKKEHTQQSLRELATRKKELEDQIQSCNGGCPDSESLTEQLKQMNIDIKKHQEIEKTINDELAQLSGFALNTLDEIVAAYGENLLSVKQGLVLKD